MPAYCPLQPPECLAMSRRAKKFTLTAQERQQLTQVEERGSDWRERRRARTVLLLAEGGSLDGVAKQQKLHKETVANHRDAWLARGFIGLRDFRGELIRAFVDVGFIHHSEVVIWKDPVTAMQRTKALGLLHKQIKKDSCMSRQGLPDYLITMRKPGENAEPVTHTNETFPVDMWQQYASPVWMDINPSDTLQYRSAREHDDERHICPLQLEVIRRAMELWSRPGDVVLSPFTGIGSEGYVSVKRGRRFYGCELKDEYYEQACKNLAKAVSLSSAGQGDLFADCEEATP